MLIWWKEWIIWIFSYTLYDCYIYIPMATVQIVSLFLPFIALLMPTVTKRIMYVHTDIEQKDEDQCQCDPSDCQQWIIIKK